MNFVTSGLEQRRASVLGWRTWVEQDHGAWHLQSQSELGILGNILAVSAHLGSALPSCYLIQGRNSSHPSPEAVKISQRPRGN